MHFYLNDPVPPTQSISLVILFVSKVDIHPENVLKSKHADLDVSHKVAKENGVISPEPNGSSRIQETEDKPQATNTTKANGKLSRKKKLKCLNEKILALKASLGEPTKKSAKKELRLRKFLKRRKALRKLIKKKTGGKRKAKSLGKAEQEDGAEDAKQAIRPFFTNVSAEMDKPLNIDKYKAFADDNDSKSNVLKSLKHATTVSSIKTWDEKDSSLLVVQRKGPTPAKRQYSDDDDVHLDSDEYNEDFDKPVFDLSIFTVPGFRGLFYRQLSLNVSI